MRKFILKIFSFIILGYIIGEIIIRVFNLNIDIPEFYQDLDGMIKNRPNQTGYYVNGNKWIINKYGQYGYEPESLDSLITVVGDSYIENIMNPSECNQAYLLANMNDRYNFFPCARGGASFIEIMEMTKSLNQFNPIKQLVYVRPGNFIGSVIELNNNPLTVQFSVSSNAIRFAKLTSNPLKKLLYKFEFAYFLYRNYYINVNDSSFNNGVGVSSDYDYDKLHKLMSFVISHYKCDNIVLVFSPDSDDEFIGFVKSYNLQIIRLKSDDYKSWQLPDDSHWSCYGHEEAAKQVVKYLD